MAKKREIRKSFKPLTEAELKISSTRLTLGRTVVLIMGVIAMLAAAIDAGYVRQFPFWLSFLLFIGGGILIGKGRGVL